MKDLVNDEYFIEEEEFVDVDNELNSYDNAIHKDARRRLEMLLEEKQLLDDIEDYH